MDSKIAALEAERDDLAGKQRRLHDLYLDGELDQNYHREKVAELKAAAAEVRRKIDDLLGRPCSARPWRVGWTGGRGRRTSAATSSKSRASASKSDGGPRACSATCSRAGASRTVRSLSAGRTCTAPSSRSAPR